MGSLERNPGGGDNWVEKAGGLPAYIEKIAKSLHEKRGFTISRAIATAVSMCKRWAAGGEDVNADTRAKAAAAIAEWNAKRAAARGRAVDLSHTDALDHVDLSAVDAELETLDLAYGDHKPPYDWKHGYVPISPQAMRVKAKKEKSPNSGKRGGSSVPSSPSTGRNVKREAAAKTAQTPKRRPSVAGAQRPARPESLDMRGAANRSPVGGGSAAAREQRAAQARARDDEARGRGVVGADAGSDPAHDFTGKGARTPGAGADAVHVDRGVVRYRRNDDGSWTGHRPGNTTVTPDAATTRGLEAERKRVLASARQESAAGKPRKDLPGGGSYPTKSDGSPDYGAMSSEQAATIRAQQAGRGVGARVQTDGGPGVVKSVSSRGTLVELDEVRPGREPDMVRIGAGTPGHDRIRPLGDTPKKKPSSLRADLGGDVSRLDTPAQQAKALRDADITRVNALAREGNAAAIAEQERRQKPAYKRARAKADQEAQGKYVAAQNERRDNTPPADLTDTQLETARAQNQPGTPRQRALDAELERRGLRTNGNGGQTVGRATTPAERREAAYVEARRESRREGATMAERSAAQDKAAKIAKEAERAGSPLDEIALDEQARRANGPTAPDKPSGRDPRSTGRSAGSSESGQTTITPATAGRMSDAQLEKTLDRLAAAGDFSSPAFKAVEAEQAKREDAKAAARRAEGNRPRR